MTNIDKLLQDLKDLQNNEKNTVPNNPDTWRKIGEKDWVGAGFIDEADALAWIEKNAYSNI
mgnify:CR=1 FL=1